MRKFLSNIRRSVVEVTLPLWTRFRRKAGYKPLSENPEDLVVSLTTFPGRIGSLWIVLDSLFRQTLRPGKIVLVLSGQEFPGGRKDLPSSLDKFFPLGLEVVFVPWNFRCHNKYFYSLKAFRDSTVVTVDDDCYYRKDTLERLAALHERYPEAVCCNIAAVIDPMQPRDYASWKKSSSELPPSPRNVALGFAGVLYPPRMPEILFDSELLLKLAPTADDLWLKAVELSEGIDVASGPFFPKPVTIKGSQKISLRKVNKGPGNLNNIQWNALDGHFNLISKI